MDKEMKAKVDEILTTNGKRELSMDELDKVSGGKDSPLDFTLLPESDKTDNKSEFEPTILELRHPK